MKDKNIAVRVTWATFQALEQIRSERTVQDKKKTTLSDIVREVLENHVGDTWKQETN